MGESQRDKMRSIFLDTIEVNRANDARGKTEDLPAITTIPEGRINKGGNEAINCYLHEIWSI